MNRLAIRVTHPLDGLTVVQGVLTVLVPPSWIAQETERPVEVEAQWVEMGEECEVTRLGVVRTRTTEEQTQVAYALLTGIADHQQKPVVCGDPDGLLSLCWAELGLPSRIEPRKEDTP